MSPPLRRSLLIAHPGATSLLYPLVGLLQRLPLDVSFVTSFYDTPTSPLRRLANALPGPLGRRLHREIGRRRHPDIDATRVRTRPWPELLHILAARAGSPALSARLLRWRNDRFDRAMAAEIERARPTFFVGFDGSARDSFAACKQAGTVSILFQAIGHIASGHATLNEEKRLSPEFAGAIVDDADAAWIERNAAEALAADRVVVPSAYVRDTLVEHGRDPASIDLLPFPIDVARFAPARTPRREGPLRALFVGQIGMRKGVKYLLEAAKLLPPGAVEVVLVGGLSDGEAWLAPYAGLYRHVRNVPYAEMPAIFRDADAFVFPSLHEGSAMATNEALASGLPCIVTANAGSIVQEGVEGWIVPLRDPAAIAARLAQLAADPALRERMGRAARVRAEAHDFAAYSRAFAALLDGLVPPAG